MGQRKFGNRVYGFKLVGVGFKMFCMKLACGPHLTHVDGASSRVRASPMCLLGRYVTYFWGPGKSAQPYTLHPNTTPYMLKPYNVTP